jgi:hypothetical protein
MSAGREVVALGWRLLPCRGHHPHVEVEPTTGDIAANRDPERLKAIELRYNGMG